MLRGEGNLYSDDPFTTFEKQQGFHTQKAL